MAAASESSKHWRVILSKELWDQRQYEHLWRTQPGANILPQSKGRAHMRITPAFGDTVQFVWNKEVVMEGEVVSAGFQRGKEHQQHACNRGAIRPHAENELFAYVRIHTVGLHKPAPLTGQRTWLPYHRID